MTSLLLFKEYLKGFYNKYSQRHPAGEYGSCLPLAMFAALNMNHGLHDAADQSPGGGAPVPGQSAVLPVRGGRVPGGLRDGGACVCGVCGDGGHRPGADIWRWRYLYFGFKPGDSFLMALTPLAFLSTDALRGAACWWAWAGGVASVIPVSCGIFLYYLLMYVKQNASALTSEATADLVQRYVQIIQSILFNQNDDGDDRHLRGGDHCGVPDPAAVHGLRVGGCCGGGFRGGASGGRLWAILCSACPWRRGS